ARQILAPLLQRRPGLAVELVGLLLHRRVLQLEALLRRRHVGDPALDVLQLAQLLLVRVVEGLPGILRAVEQLGELRLADYGRASHQAWHTSFLLGRVPTVSLATVLLHRSMDSGWLSNAYVLGDEPGGVAVFVDSGAPL